MNIGYSSSQKQSICEEVRMFQLAGMDLPDILDFISKKYNVDRNRIYSWNKKAGMIFSNKLFSEDEKKSICIQVANKIFDGENVIDAIINVAQKFKIGKYLIYKWNRKLKIFDTKFKYTDQEKIRFLEDVVAFSESMDGIGAATVYVADLIGVARQTIYSWNRQFKIFETRVYKNRKSSPYDRQFIDNVLRNVLDIGVNPENIKIVAGKYNISTNTLYAWNRKYRYFDTKYFSCKNQNSR